MISNKIKFTINRHFEENYILYSIIFFALTLGIAAGALLSGLIKSSDKQGLVKYLDFFFKSLESYNMDYKILIASTIRTNIRSVLLIYILGLSVILGPLSIIIVAYRGFVLGFSTAIIFSEFGFKGIVFVTLAILPQNIFMITGLIIITVLTLNHSFSFIKKHRFKRYKNKTNYLNRLVSYTINISLFSLLILIGSILEAYFTPLVLKILY